MAASVTFFRVGSQRLVCAAVLALQLIGCASTPGADADPSDDAFFEAEILGAQVPDPLEPANRPVFAANMAMDTYFMEPISRAYGAVTPRPIKNAVRRIFANLNAPVVMV
jgi:ABC-type transporter lipoprotein component MlaA